MKKIEVYICDICGTQYKDKAKCERCEKHHVRVGEIIDAKYNAMDQGSFDGLPIKVTVKFLNGKIADYRR